MIVSQIRRSDTANKRPDPALLLSGELALNYDVATGGVYYTNDAGTLTKIGPAQLSATAPNSTPAGSAGNAIGEFWYDTANNALNIWNGSQWVTVSSGAPGSYATGGRLLEAIGPTTTAAAVLVNFTSAQINDLPNIGYSNGIFTNTTADTRTYTFDFTLCLNNAGGYFTDLTLWYQKNSTANADPTNSYGLNQFSKGYTTNDAKNDRTSWTFTLEPGETVTCWASFTPQSVQFGGAGEGTTSGYSTRVNVTEVVTAATGYQSGGFAEYGNTQSALAAGVSARVAWNAVTTAPDYTLTYNSGTNSFTNNTLQTRTYTFNASMGGTASQLFTEWDGWFTLNNPTGVVSSTTRFGQQSVSDTGFGEFSSSPQALRTFSWTVTLLPGESVQTWQYCNVNFTSNGPIQTPGATFGSGAAMKLRVTEIQAAQSPDWGGRFEARMPSTSYTGSGNNILNAWSLVDNNTITSLSYANGIFTNSTNQDRTYKISFNVTLSNAALQERYYTWIQWDASTASATNRLSYLTDDTREYLTTSVAAASLSITLAPGGTFSTWFYTNGAGTKTIGGASFGMSANYSTRIAVQDVTAIQSGFGTITGVNAGIGLSGGGTTGTVTLNLDPATSSTLGGVKQGNTVAIASDGTLTVNPAGANTQIQFNDNGVLGANANFTYDSTLGKLTTQAITGLTTQDFYIFSPNSTGSAVTNFFIQGGQGSFTTAGSAANGGAVTLEAGRGTGPAGQPGNGGLLTVRGGATFGGVGGNLVVKGGGYYSFLGTDQTGSGGDTVISGGDANGAAFTSGDVTIAAGAVINGATKGSVQISDISAASATATYTPTAATDLTTKSYVDGKAAPAGGNGDLQFNNNGAFGAVSYLDLNTSLGVLTVPSILGSGAPGGGFSFTIDADTNQGISVKAGNGISTNPAPGAGLYGGNTTFAQAAGDVVIQGGRNSDTVTGARGGNVTISGGTSVLGTAGTVNLSNIATASATATYTPTAATDLATKSYVDSTSTPAAGSNTQIQFNNNGAFGANANFTYNSTLGKLTTQAITGLTTQDFYIFTPDATSGPVTRFFIQGGQGSFGTSGPAGNGGEVTLEAGWGGGAATGNQPGNGGLLTVRGGSTFGGVGGNLVVKGGSYFDNGVTLGGGGDTAISGGDANGAAFTSGDVTISAGAVIGGATKGSVQISDISAASATATYTPTAATDLATKSYVDSQRTPAAGSNAQVQFNDNGAFGAEAGFEYDSTNNVLKSNNYSSVGSVSVYGAPGSGPAAGGNLTLAAGSAGTGAISPAVLNILGADNPANNVTSLGGSINIVAGTGQRPLASGVSGGTITILGGAGRAFFGATVASGDVNIQGGNGTGSFNQGAANGGNVNITGGGFYNGGAAGVVNITSIATATATATYTPTAATHLTTKSYVDTLIGAQAAGTNTQIQFNNNGAFGASADLFFNAASGIFGAPSFVGTGTAGTLSIFGGTNQGLTLSAGSGTNATPAPGVGLYGGNTAQLFNGGDVIVQGGNNTAAGAGARGGNVTISGGTSTNAAAGTVNISNIATASATATYVPTANTDLATKAYVDTGVVSFDGGTF